MSSAKPIKVLTSSDRHFCCSCAGFAARTKYLTTGKTDLAIGETDLVRQLQLLKIVLVDAVAIVVVFVLNSVCLPTGCRWKLKRLGLDGCGF
jgi:hypothetical protein